MILYEVCITHKRWQQLSGSDVAGQLTCLGAFCPFDVLCIVMPLHGIHAVRCVMLYLMPCLLSQITLHSGAAHIDRNSPDGA